MIQIEKVRQYATDAGADVVGIADAKDFGAAPDGFKPTDVMPECVSVIVLGATFPPEVMNNTVEYTANRNEMISKMTDIAKKTAKRIAKDDYKTKAISAIGGKWVESIGGKKESWGFISLKHAAELAGLGVIGKNYLLTNPDYGNLLWFSAVLTDAKLVPSAKSEYKICENCNKCVEACPTKALDNISAFGKRGCASNFKIMNKKLEIQCFLCRRVCPFGLGTETKNKTE